MGKLGIIVELLGITEKIEDLKDKGEGGSIPNMRQEKRTKTAVMSFQYMKDKETIIEKREETKYKNAACFVHVHVNTWIKTYMEYVQIFPFSSYQCDMEE